MKVLKIFLIIGLAFLLGAAGAAGYVWYLVQDALSVDVSPVVEQVDADLDAPAQQTFNGSVANTVPAEGVALPPDALSVQQKAIAESLGINVDSFVLTPQMVECAEEKLGTTRIEEIMAGDAPSILESARLAPCL